MPTLEKNTIAQRTEHDVIQAVDNIQHRLVERVAEHVSQGLSQLELSEELITEALEICEASYGFVLHCQDHKSLSLEAVVQRTSHGTISRQHDVLLNNKPDQAVRDVMDILKPMFSNNLSDITLSNLPRMHPEISCFSIYPMHENGAINALVIILNARQGFDIKRVQRLQSLLNAFMSVHVNDIVCRSLNKVLDGVERHTKPLFKKQQTTQAGPEYTQLRTLTHKPQLFYHDPLTGLPDRIRFLDCLHHALIQRSALDVVSLLFIDIDGFKAVNDTMGHDAGDELLRQVARRLRQATREGDTVARLGGDEFTVTLNRLKHRCDASEVADAIVHAIRQPFVLQQGDVYVSASIGIATASGLHNDSSIDTGNLIKQADTALYRAKVSGRSRHVFFTPALAKAERERSVLITSLRRAVDRQNFELYYQPQVLINNDHLLGFEALLRWPQGSGEPIGPCGFIDVLEETGLIHEVGEWALAKACEQHTDWLQRGLIGPATTMSVNVSARQLEREHFAQKVATILRQYSMRPDSLILEITESALVQNIETDVIKQIKALGIQISLDDFGTGYSSLSYLSQLPFDHLKIDRSFIADIERFPHAFTVIKSIIALANTLGIRVIAEGVESASVLPLLASEGCEGYQGFYFSRPLPANKMAIKLESLEKVQLSHFANFIDLGKLRKR